MLDKLEIFAMARGLISHANARQSAIAQNVANADTPGYRARDVASFADTYRGEAGNAMRATRAGHTTHNDGATGLDLRQIDAPGPSSPNGNTVALETEMMKSSQVRAEHDRALAIYRSSMNILRASIGR
ncbi:MAG: flagellar basal-body rod protein FlgB [Halocynthiibacter sp.]|jgi:flagellar basal-body rod protein FlgB